MRYCGNRIVHLQMPSRRRCAPRAMRELRRRTPAREIPGPRARRRATRAPSRCTSRAAINSPSRVDDAGCSDSASARAAISAANALRKRFEMLGSASSCRRPSRGRRICRSEPGWRVAMLSSASRMLTPATERAEPRSEPSSARAKAITGRCSRSLMRPATSPTTPLMPALVEQTQARAPRRRRR